MPKHMMLFGKIGNYTCPSELPRRSCKARKATQITVNIVISKGGNWGCFFFLLFHGHPLLLHSLNPHVLGSSLWPLLFLCVFFWVPCFSSSFKLVVISVYLWVPSILIAAWNEMRWDEMMDTCPFTYNTYMPPTWSHFGTLFSGLRLREHPGSVRFGSVRFGSVWSAHFHLLVP